MPRRPANPGLAGRRGSWGSVGGDADLGEVAPVFVVEVDLPLQGGAVVVVKLRVVDG